MRSFFKKLLAVAFLLLPGMAVAQTVIQPLSNASCATLALTTASTAISAATVTMLPGNKFPTSSVGITFYIEADYANSGNLIFCPSGGTCAAASGVTMGPGNARWLRIPFLAIPPTAIASTGTQQVFLCWQAL